MAGNSELTALAPGGNFHVAVSSLFGMKNRSVTQAVGRLYRDRRPGSHDQACLRVIAAAAPSLDPNHVARLINALPVLQLPIEAERPDIEHLRDDFQSIFANSKYPSEVRARLVADLLASESLELVRRLPAERITPAAREWASEEIDRRLRNATDIEDRVLLLRHPCISPERLAREARDVDRQARAKPDRLTRQFNEQGQFVAPSPLEMLVQAIWHNQNINSEAVETLLAGPCAPLCGDFGIGVLPTAAFSQQAYASVMGLVRARTHVNPSDAYGFKAAGMMRSRWANENDQHLILDFLFAQYTAFRRERTVTVERTPTLDDAVVQERHSINAFTPQLATRLLHHYLESNVLAVPLAAFLDHFIGLIDASVLAKMPLDAQPFREAVLRSSHADDATRVQALAGGVDTSDSHILLSVDNGALHSGSAYDGPQPSAVVLARLAEVASGRVLIELLRCEHNNASTLVQILEKVYDEESLLSRPALEIALKHPNAPVELLERLGDDRTPDIELGYVASGAKSAEVLRSLLATVDLLRDPNGLPTDDAAARFGQCHLPARAVRRLAEFDPDATDLLGCLVGNPFLPDDVAVRLGVALTTDQAKTLAHAVYGKLELAARVDVDSSEAAVSCNEWLLERKKRIRTALPVAGWGWAFDTFDTNELGRLADLDLMPEEWWADLTDDPDPDIAIRYQSHPNRPPDIGVHVLEAPALTRETVDSVEFGLPLPQASTARRWQDLPGKLDVPIPNDLADRFEGSSIAGMKTHVARTGRELRALGLQLDNCLTNRSWLTASHEGEGVVLWWGDEAGLPRYAAYAKRDEQIVGRLSPSNIEGKSNTLAPESIRIAVTGLVQGIDLQQPLPSVSAETPSPVTVPDAPATGVAVAGRRDRDDAPHVNGDEEVVILSQHSIDDRDAHQAPLLPDGPSLADRSTHLPGRRPVVPPTDPNHRNEGPAAPSTGGINL